MPDDKFMKLYQEKKELLQSSVNLDAYFTQDHMGEAKLALLKIGKVAFPTGKVITCDPLVSFEDSEHFFKNIPVGEYPVLISVMLSKEYGDRYAAVKLAISEQTPVRYELALVGNEDLTELKDADDFFGFGVDAGLGCICDQAFVEEFKRYWQERLAQEEDINPYDDLFSDLLERNAQEYPLLQRSGGDWLNWQVPEGKANLALFASGWGDGYYPTYFGYDSKGQICAVYILFIDIKRELADD